MGKGHEQTFFKEDINGQQGHGKMFNIANYQGSANQNHNEIPLHACENGYYKRDKR